MVILSLTDDALRSLGASSSSSAHIHEGRGFRENIWFDVAQFDTLARPRISSSSSALTHFINLDHAIQARLGAILEELLSNQTTLPEAAQRALSEDRWALYEAV